MKNILVGIMVVLLVGAGAFVAGRFASPQVTLPSLPTPAPTPTPVIITNTAIVQQIHQVSRLETTLYTVETVVEADQQGVINTPLGQINLGSDRLLLIAHGRVTAGIDLSKLTEEDVTVSGDGKQIKVKLPPVEIFSSNIDEQKTRVYDRQTNLMGASPSLETEARRGSVYKILATACEDGIMQHANQDAKDAVERILRLSGFATVAVESAPVPSCPTTLP